MIRAALFLAAIVAANVVTDRLGLVTLAGVTVTAGTYAAGLTFVLRDGVQRRYGLGPVVGLVLVGGLVSWWLASPALALASLAAFVVSELADTGTYTLVRRWRDDVQAAAGSNVVGAVLDSLVFLSLAGFPLAAAPGQVLVKLLVACVALAALPKRVAA